MDKKAEMAQPRTSQIDERMAERTAGFTLLETLCVLAIISMIAALLTPIFSNRGDAGLRSLSIATAAVLKLDRNAAAASGKVVSTYVDAADRTIRSGASGRSLSIPSDVKIETTLAKRCSGVQGDNRIRFFPNGLSCGGVITFKRSSSTYEVRVNWYTGLPEVISGP